MYICHLLQLPNELDTNIFVYIINIKNILIQKLSPKFIYILYNLYMCMYFYFVAIIVISNMFVEICI